MLSQFDMNVMLCTDTASGYCSTNTEFIQYCFHFYHIKATTHLLGQESYELLNSSCSHLFKSINKIITNEKISVDREDIIIEMLLGGDYKVYN